MLSSTTQVRERRQNHPRNKACARETQGDKIQSLKIDSAAILPVVRKKTHAHKLLVVSRLTRFSDFKSCPPEFRAHTPYSKVQFADYDRVTPVRKVSSFSRPNVWFVDYEFGAFYDETMKTVERMEQGKALRDRKYTATGLENFTDEGRALKIAFREDAYDVVLMNQDAQGDYEYQRGRRGSFLLAHAYQQIAEDAQKIAVTRAQQLRNDIVPYLICDSPSSTGSKGSKNKRKKQKKQQKPQQQELPQKPQLTRQQGGRGEALLVC